MEERKVQFDYVQSEGFGSIERLARTMANNGYRTIVVVGGDGAINEAVNGIMHSEVEDKRDIALGLFLMESETILPGTGDWIRMTTKGRWMC